MQTRKPRHYLSYVREELIASWKVHAVLGEHVGKKRVSARRTEWTRKACRKQAALLDGSEARVWPWAFQLGRTYAARSLKKGDVIWIVAHLSGFGRSWPPALVARMRLAEDAWLGPASRSARKQLPFPFHFGVALFARSEDGRFFPANDATLALLESQYQTPLKEVPDVGRLPRTSDAHGKAWAAASRTGFCSLRRIQDPTPLVKFADRLRTHSIFLSYRWLDHSEGSKERECLRDMAETLMLRKRIGVWLDNLTLPPSKHDKERRNAVISQLLSTPLQETPLLVAHVTTNYGGPSADLGPKKPGYTLQEWGSSKRVFAWEHSPSQHADLLRKEATPCHRCPPNHRVAQVAREIQNCLSTAGK